jgi:hypothetical protein
MRAKSKKQQMVAGVALAAKEGRRSKSSLKGASKKMAESMSEKQLKDFAKTKRGNLPERKILTSLRPNLSVHTPYLPVYVKRDPNVVTLT